MPTPEGHECGIACGLHMQHVPNATGVVRSYLLPSELQRVLLSRAASRSPAVNSTAPRAPSRCLFSWGGAVRGRSNPARNELLKLRGSPGMCIVNTEDAQMVKERPPNIPEAMMESRFCYSPRGWDQGDSDRYLPAVVYGCVPVMSDRLEAMPLEVRPPPSHTPPAHQAHRHRISHHAHLFMNVIIAGTPRFELERDSRRHREGGAPQPTSFAAGRLADRRAADVGQRGTGNSADALHDFRVLPIERSPCSLCWMCAFSHGLPNGANRVAGHASLF